MHKNSDSSIALVECGFAFIFPIVLNVSSLAGSSSAAGVAVVAASHPCIRVVSRRLISGHVSTPSRARISLSARAVFHFT